MSEAEDIAVAFGAHRCLVCGKLGPQRLVTVGNFWDTSTATPFSLVVEVCCDVCADRAANRTAEIRLDAANWDWSDG